jgi:hypothetical protein
MNDTVFYLLDALLGAARGMLLSSRAEQIKEKYGLEKDPRSKLTEIATGVPGSAAINLVSSYFLTQGMEDNAKSILGSRGITSRLQRAHSGNGY